MKRSGKEESLLDILKGMKADPEFKPPEKKWQRRGKHSGSMAFECEHFGDMSISDVDVLASIYQMTRNGKRKKLLKHPIKISKTDIRCKRFREKTRNSILFVVDGSRSQGAKERLAFAKGAVMAVLSQAYCDRDRAGMIVFGDKRAELVLPFTRSVDLAADRMTELKAKGNTPLSMGLRRALEVIDLERMKNSHDRYIVVLLTDGRSNYDERPGKPLKLVEDAAEEIRERHIQTLVIDTENSIFGLGLAAVIASKAGAEYVKL